MTEPTSPPPSAPPPLGPSSTPSPFDRPPSSMGRTGTGPGVGKPLLIGCGVLLLLVLVLGVLFVANQNKIVAWLFEVMESELAPMLPEDLPSDVRQRYDVAFDEAIGAFRAGEYDPFAMQELSRVMREVAEKGQRGSVTEEDVERLSTALERVAGGAAEDTEAPVEESRLRGGPGAAAEAAGKAALLSIRSA